MTISTSRRGFLKASAAAVLIVGLRPDGALASGADQTALNPFVRIGADGRVTAIIKHFEMGQGPSTGLTTLIAEELGVTMEQIDYEFAPSNPQVYNNLLFGPFQGTGGSTAMANSFGQYRNAGAAAREMLIAAAAEAWGVEAAGLDIVDGMVTGDGKSAPIAAFVAAAAGMTAPEEPALRPPETWRLIGKDGAVKRKDTPVKINGSGTFAMDLQLDNQLVVVIARAPRMGAKVIGVETGAAEGMRGFVMAKPMPDGAGVAVFAETTWAAIQAREAIGIDWDMSAAEGRSSDQIKEELIAAVSTDSAYQPKGDQAEVAAAVDGAATVIDRTFYFPLLSHAPMEPLTCTIEPTADGGAILHDGAQFPTFGHMTLHNVLGIPMEKIQVNTVLAGGSFGRRATPTADYNVECALAFSLTDGTRPVKLVWTREDDIRGGYYRPAFAHRVRVGLDPEGKILGWDHRIAGQSIMKGTAFEPMSVKDGVDHSSVEGIADTPYAVPGMAVGLTDHDRATSVLWWRSVGHTHTAYVMESMMDMVARTAGTDPIALRLSMLPRETPAQSRMAGVLEEIARITDWEAGAPEGRSRGVAVHHSFGSFVAEVVEVSSDADGVVKIEKVSAAVDCGIPVNPDVIRAQIEGGIGYGLGAVMRNEITLTDGAVDQSNFPDYEPLRISDIGAIEVSILLSSEAPSGIGEPGTPPAGPALANAIARAGQARVTELPMSGQVDFA